MSIPQPPQPPDPLLGPLGQAVPRQDRPQKSEGWSIKCRRDGCVVWHRVRDGREEFWTVSEGV